jgi:adenosylcobinamide-GDP ribazoletransferase
MRRGDIGPSGVAAVTLVLLLDAAALTSLLPSWGGSALAVVALVSSRQLLAWACARPVPSARADGLGATVAGSVAPATWALSTVVVAALAAGAGLAADLAWWAGPVVLAAAAAAGALVVHRAVVRLGGITGDVLGAVVEVAFAVGLTAAAVVLPHAA